MNRRTAVQSLLAAGAGSIFARLAASAAFAGPQQGESGILRLTSEARLVLLDVSVKDTAGGFVSGLAKDNFKVFENGRLQPITVFDTGDVPVTIGLLVDASGSMKPKRSEVLIAAETFIQESNRQDEIFVLNFNDTVVPGLSRGVLFSDNLEQLNVALRHTPPAGMTALYDAVVQGLMQLAMGKRDKKTLVLISDGGDNTSAHTRRETLDMVESNIATVYTIGLFENDDPDRDPGILRQLARISGGEAFFPESPAETIPACRRIAKDIRNRYTIGYVPPEQNGTKPIRTISVRASAPNRGKLIVRTRTSYRFDAEQRS